MNRFDLEQKLKVLKQNISKGENIKTFALAGFAMLALSISAESMAGKTGTEFQPAWEKMVELVGGFGGKMIAGVSLGIALIGSALRFNPLLIFGSLGTGIAAAFGTTVIDKVVTAII